MLLIKIYIFLIKFNPNISFKVLLYINRGLVGGVYLGRVYHISEGSKTYLEGSIGRN